MLSKSINHFIDGLPESADDSGIIKTIIALGHGLDCTVLAEGVETPAQAQWLAENNCHYATGYFFARPMPGKKLEEWLLTSGHLEHAGMALLSNKA